MEKLEWAVRRVRKGDSRAFRRIVEATSARLIRLAARMLGNMEDAEDVVQESYVKAYRSIVAGAFDGRSAPETWLYRIVANTAVDALRKRARHPVPAAGQDADGVAVEADTSAEARAALAELEQVMVELPAEQRAALVLKAVEGLSSKEVATTLGITEGAVEQRLVRARVTLRGRFPG